jgi:hypothetical protein
MSSLLERAIVDAAALKETALKNAENLVIEKYSQEVKHAVNRLLEAEMDFGAPAMGADSLDDPLGAPQPMGEDPLAGFGEDPAPEEEMGDSQGPTIDPNSVAAELPDSFLDNSDDDDIIRIKLDSLEAEFDEDEDGVFGGDDELEDDEIGIDISDLELEDDEYEDNEYEGEDEEEPDIGLDIEALSEVVNDLDLEDFDVSTQDVVEALRVDIDPQKSGWAGTPEPLMREYENMLLARENDDEVREENEELRKRVSELQKENKILGSASLKLREQNNEYCAAFGTLKEKLEQTNVSNAKLLYINQALENASLNERQKRKVVEAISKAGSVSEAKIVYETLQDTISSGRNAPEKSINSLSEAVHRKSTLLMAGRRQHEEEKSADPFFDRMQKLAGIKNN